MTTVTVDIIDDNALKLLKDLEAMNVIRLREEHPEERKATLHGNSASLSMSAKYSGAMTKQPIQEVERQLNDLRNEWN